MEKSIKVAFASLGCRMNQFEISGIKQQFYDNNFIITDFDSSADVYIVNTCSVTNDADRTSRKVIRQAKRKNPKAVVVATGCYAQISPDELSKMEEVDIVVGNSQKTDIYDIVQQYINERQDQKVFIENIFTDNEFKTFKISTFFEGSRPILKIQEGCNSFCSFCIIPYARGKVRSGNVNDIVNQIKVLVENGYKEIVLTGTQLSQYGRDHKQANLIDLLKKITDIDGLYLVRLSSMGINEIDDYALDFLTDNPKIAPHFHLSIQSADDRVLKDMRRDYTVKEYMYKVNRILSRRPQAAIGTDVITGFPTEDKQAFLNTVENIRDIPFAYIHVFTYSPRKGTHAYKLKNVVKPEEKKERTRILMEISKEKNEQFRKKFLKTPLDFLLISEKDGYKIGLSPNYIHAKINTNHKVNSVVKAKITKVGEDREENYAEVENLCQL